MRVRITETTHHGDTYKARYRIMSDASEVRDFLTASPYNNAGSSLEVALTAHTLSILSGGPVYLTGASLEFGWATYTLTRLD